MKDVFSVADSPNVMSVATVSELETMDDVQNSSHVYCYHQKHLVVS
jgi:hypothetical protein